MSPFLLMLLGTVVAWNGANCNGSPLSATVDFRFNQIEPFFTHKEKHNGKNVDKIPGKYFYGSHHTTETSRQLHDQSVPSVEPAIHFDVNAGTSYQQPMIAQDKILDNLHDHNGEKLQVYHSALDGWIF